MRRLGRPHTAAIEPAFAFEQRQLDHLSRTVDGLWVSRHRNRLGTCRRVKRMVDLPGAFTDRRRRIVNHCRSHGARAGIANHGRQLVFLGRDALGGQIAASDFYDRDVSGALAWGVGNLLWRAGWPFNRVVPWWIAFLALTIVGERLDLSRFQRPSKWSQPLLDAALGIFAAGLLLTSFTQIAGERLLGLGLVALAAWLGCFDIARRTVRQHGLSRFMAACLLAGYVWLAAAGALMMAFSPLESGLRYDAVLHSFFLGFVFSMIFGHAPVIFPAVLGLQPSFRTAFYAHAALLHLGLILRVGADVARWGVGRQWGGSLNALAIGLFLINTVLSFVVPVKPQVASDPSKRQIA
jgi:hypothetical protein